MLDFKDIRDERSRTYVFSSGEIRIDEVVRICVRPSGGHRLETKSNDKYIIAPGWLAIKIDTDSWSI